MSKKSLSPVEATPGAWYDAGLRLLQAGRAAEAEQCGRKALALDSGHADSLHLMGMLCIAAKNYDLAIEWCAQAIRHRPDAASYFSNLGLALQRKDRFDEAIKSYNRALVLKPDQAEVWFRMGECLRERKRIDEAIMSFDHALRINPNHADAARIGGLLNLEEGRYEQAIVNFDHLIRARPTLAGAFKLKGFCQLQLNRFDEALASSIEALELAPDDIEILNNIALALHRLGRNEEALAHTAKALALNPAAPATYVNRAQSLLAMLRFEEAIAALDTAIAIDPQFDLARWNLALTQLLLGDFKSGWSLRECGRTRLGFFIDRKFKQPQWLGEEPIAGKTILLHSDEGFGDTIQYVRYSKLVARLGARVILQVDEPVRTLVSGMEGAALCLPRTEIDLPDFDVHCPLSALPLAFNTRVETIPSEVPYLPAPADKLRQTWEERLGPRDKMRIGLVWSGSPTHGNDRNRSMPLRTMCGVLDVDARFFSLQKDPRANDRSTLRERPDIIDLTAHITDFSETAAMISCLDLVITVDTSVAHLGGALGKPTWILLPYAPDFRWLLDRDDSPWYPTARLFRQSESREYESVIERVRSELQALAGAVPHPAN